jgi:hypothetical protein
MMKFVSPDYHGWRALLLVVSCPKSGVIFCGRTLRIYEEQRHTDRQGLRTGLAGSTSKLKARRQPVWLWLTGSSLVRTNYGNLSLLVDLPRICVSPGSTQGNGVASNEISTVCFFGLLWSLLVPWAGWELVQSRRWKPRTNPNVVNDLEQAG